MSERRNEIVWLVDRVRCAGGRRRNNAVTSQLLHSFFTAVTSQLLNALPIALMIDHGRWGEVVWGSMVLVIVWVCCE